MKKIILLLFVLIPMVVFGQGSHKHGVTITDSARVAGFIRVTDSARLEGFVRVLDSLYSEGLINLGDDLILQNGDTLNYITDDVISINGTELDYSDHDALLNFVADEHIDWTNTSEELTTTNDINADTVHSDVQQTDFIVGSGDSYKIITGADSLVLVSYTASGDSGVVTLDSGVVSMAFFENGAERSITIDTNGITVRDDAEGKGLKFFGDYNLFGGLNLLSADFINTHLGLRLLDESVYSPGEEQDNAILVYDYSDSIYYLKAGIPEPQIRGVHHSAMDTIVFSNTSVDTLEFDLNPRAVWNLPVGTVIHTIDVYVATAFDGSGTDLLDIGIGSDGNRYEDDLDISGTGFKTLSLTNIKDRMAASTYITFQYFDQNTDAAHGEAYIYVEYSIQ